MVTKKLLIQKSRAKKSLKKKGRALACAALTVLVSSWQTISCEVAMAAQRPADSPAAAAAGAAPETPNQGLSVPSLTRSDLIVGQLESGKYLSDLPAPKSQSDSVASQRTPIRLAALNAGINADPNNARGQNLTPGAREAANLLGILPKVERLIQLNRSRPEGQQMSDEELSLKVDVLDRVMGGSLEVRMVSGRIDREVAWAFSNQGALQAKRQKILNGLFTLNFMQGGILGVLSGPAFLHGEHKTGTELLLLGSSIGLALSIVSFAEARSGSRKMDTETTVLADVYGLNTPEPLHKTQIVTKYMRSVPPASTDSKTRSQALMEGWQKRHKLRSVEERNLRKMAGLQGPEDRFRENIGLLSARIRMLFDTQYTIEELDSDLLDILRATDIN